MSEWEQWLCRCGVFRQARCDNTAVFLYGHLYGVYLDKAAAAEMLGTSCSPNYSTADVNSPVWDRPIAM